MRACSYIGIGSRGNDGERGFDPKYGIDFITDAVYPNSGSFLVYLR